MTTSKKSRRYVLWAVFNGALAGLVVLGPVAGYEVAANILKFWLWVYMALAAVVAWVAAIMEPADLENEESSHVPASASLLVDVAVITALAGCGWFVHATVKAVTTALEQMAFLMIKAKRAEAAMEAAK